jgi:hypothetical protein
MPFELQLCHFLFEFMLKRTTAENQESSVLDFVPQLGSGVNKVADAFFGAKPSTGGNQEGVPRQPESLAKFFASRRVDSGIDLGSIDGVGHHTNFRRKRTMASDPLGLGARQANDSLSKSQAGPIQGFVGLHPAVFPCPTAKEARHGNFCNVPGKQTNDVRFITVSTDECKPLLPDNID